MTNHARNISAVIDYIESHLTENLDLEFVSRAAHYSKYHLHRVFTKTVGLTIHDYIQRRQLTEAAKLLVFSDRPILEIALLSGYDSQQAFTSAFKAMYKQSPNRFRENEEFYPLQLRFKIQKRLTKINAMTRDRKPAITLASEKDIPLWMELARLVVDGFPCFIEDEYIKVLKQCITENRALIMKDEAIAIGILIFSYHTGSIDFLGVHPQYRKRGIAKAFLKKVMDEFLQNSEICLTTFREGDAADNGSRAILKKLGFAESEFMVEFGYPTQKFVLPVHSREETFDE